MRLMTTMVVVAMFLALGCGETEPTHMTKAEARVLAARGLAEGIDLCAEHGWYGDGECDTFCGQPDPDCTCATAGGECVPVVPGACEGGTIADYSCGGGVGVMCCLAAPQPAPTDCAKAGGECVPVVPGSCEGGVIGEQSCGGGVGVMCCFAAPAPDPIPCAAAGGECVAVVPDACEGGVIGDADEYSCGGGVGVMCCFAAR